MSNANLPAANPPANPPAQPGTCLHASDQSEGVNIAFTAAPNYGSFWGGKRGPRYRGTSFGTRKGYKYGKRRLES